MSGLAEKVRKPRPAPAEPYCRSPRPPKKDKDTPRTSAKPTQNTRWQNLTLADWLRVYAYVDEHPRMGQQAVVNYFKDLHTGALVFTQETSSRNLKPDRRKEREGQATANPTALSSKHPWIVTRLDVERALVLWVHSMEDKGETVTGDMLIEKRRQFEDGFNVPEEERLKNGGWLASFQKTCTSCSRNQTTLSKSSVIKSRRFGSMERQHRVTVILQPLKSKGFRKFWRSTGQRIASMQMRLDAIGRLHQTADWQQNRSAVKKRTRNRSAYYSHAAKPAKNCPRFS